MAASLSWAVVCNVEIIQIFLDFFVDIIL